MNKEIGALTTSLSKSPWSLLADPRGSGGYTLQLKNNAKLGPALSRYGLTPVADRDHAEIKVEFAVHPLMLGLTTDYQLLLDTLLEQISAFGNAKEKRLNRVLTAAAVDDLAERLLLQRYG